MLSIDLIQLFTTFEGFNQFRAWFGMPDERSPGHCSFRHDYAHHIPTGQRPKLSLSRIASAQPFKNTSKSTASSPRTSIAWWQMLEINAIKLRFALAPA